MVEIGLKPYHLVQVQDAAREAAEQEIDDAVAAAQASSPAVRNAFVPGTTHPSLSFERLVLCAR
jgi:hypothetical protein